MIGVAMVGVECFKLTIGFFLAGEQLDHRHAGDRLAQIGVDARDPFADLAIGAGAL